MTSYYLCLFLPLCPTHPHPHRERTMPTYRQQRNVVVLVLHRSADVGGEERGGVRMYMYSATICRPGSAIPWHTYTILHYTTLHYRIYLSIRFTRTGNPVCYLPTYLLSVSMVWYGMSRWQMDIVNFQGHVVSQMITSSISLSVPSKLPSCTT